MTGNIRQPLDRDSASSDKRSNSSCIGDLSFPVFVRQLLANWYRVHGALYEAAPVPRLSTAAIKRQPHPRILRYFRRDAAPNDAIFG